MSDWLTKRREYEEDRARAAGMERIVDPPEWVREAVPDSLRQPQNEGTYETFDGDSYAYRAIAAADGCVFFRARKSDYYTTTRNVGVCPHCQDVVARLPGDAFLTCHRCGWTVGRPLWRWIRYPSWLSSLAREVRNYSIR